MSGLVTPETLFGNASFEWSSKAPGIEGGSAVDQFYFLFFILARLGY